MRSPNGVSELEDITLGPDTSDLPGSASCESLSIGEGIGVKTMEVGYTSNLVQSLGIVLTDGNYAQYGARNS